MSRKRRDRMPDVASLMAELNEALNRDFDPRRARQIHGKTVPELMAERDARERAAARERSAFDDIIRASWPHKTTDN